MIRGQKSLKNRLALTSFLSRVSLIFIAGLIRMQNRQETRCKQK